MLVFSGIDVILARWNNKMSHVQPSPDLCLDSQRVCEGGEGSNRRYSYKLDILHKKDQNSTLINL